jgi:hypothetical protein
MSKGAPEPQCEEPQTIGFIPLGRLHWPGEWSVHPVLPPDESQGTSYQKGVYPNDQLDAVVQVVDLLLSEE